MEDIRDQIQRLYKDFDMEPEKIALELDVPLPSVLAILWRDSPYRLHPFHKPSDTVERLSAATKRAIVDGYLQYFPLTSLGRQHGLKPLEVWDVVLESGVPQRDPPPPIRKFIRRSFSRQRRGLEAVAWYRAGVPRLEIWAFTGVEFGRLNALLDVHGVPRRERKAAAAQQKKWHALWEGDKPEKELPQWTTELVKSIKEK